MTTTREQIKTHVTEHPGVHFNEIGRALDIATGQTQYHLRRLIHDDVIDSRSLVGRTHYYPAGFEPWEQRALALLRRETAREILLTLLETGTQSAPALTDEIGIARSTLSWHLSNLADADLINTETVDGEVRVTPRRPERLADLARTVSPSLPNRFVDRFERFVDDALVG
ncbi:winged helix-turn-helix transcriptional regulator [Halonotius roseus]|uniref:Winged helix-turn-helix transcriptional regulator n=1 Tax=Halonotius roseus TaxID=2511997 RepID=A0A544QM36_9EURY|nr:helix-turn-helix domain-containing protein [Halonotius roseus]TQQ79623.1 winged helix-turn-helix transcriptional regulator [Halonotius roseus]